MRKGKIVGKIIGLIFLVIVVFLAATLFVSFDHSESKKLGTYNSVMKNSIKNNNARVVDIAMLGAHDAFSNGISTKSEPDYNEGGIVTNTLVNKVAKALVVKMSKAQTDSAKNMLYKGVRYFDVRITKVEDTYYCYHGYLSSTLEYYVNDVVDFLKTNPGEFVIFDIQHFYTSNGDNSGLPDSDWTDLYTFLENKGLTSYINYSSKELKSLTYGDVTLDGTKGGVVMLAKTDKFANVYSRDGDANKDESRVYTSARSYWHSRNSDKDMIDGINGEYFFIKNHPEYKDILRINQAQKTGFIMNASLVRSLLNWSLLNLANNFNAELVSDEDRFNSWLEEMPIFMVDYATSSKGDFNNKVNELVNNYNKQL